jgi:hypothetical protein
VVAAQALTATHATVPTVSTPQASVVFPRVAPPAVRRLHLRVRPVSAKLEAGDDARALRAAHDVTRADVPSMPTLIAARRQGSRSRAGRAVPGSFASPDRDRARELPQIDPTTSSGVTAGGSGGASGGGGMSPFAVVLLAFTLAALSQVARVLQGARADARSVALVLVVERPG